MPSANEKNMKPKAPIRTIAMDRRLRTFDEVIQTYTKEEARQEAQRRADLSISAKEWSNACPLGTDIQGFVQAAAEGDLDTALEMIYRENPFPRSLGRFCHRHCERRLFQGAGAGLQIRALERAVGELGRPPLPVMKAAGATGKRVAAIGSGPAALALAYFLRLKGHAITIFEQFETVGGLITLGVPNFRFEQSSFVKESDVAAWGVRLLLNQTIDRPFFEKLPEQFDAVFIATGRARSVELKIAGIGAEGVYDALFYLRERALRRSPSVGKKVVIIGGGYSSLDVARTVLRLGSQPIVLYRRTRKEMPVSVDPLLRAEEEGVIFHFLTGASAILSDQGRVNGVECQRFELLKPELGRESPLSPLAGSAFVLEADTVVTAVGQEVDLSFLPDDIRITDGGLITVERPSYMTSRPGVFAAGDIAGDRGIDGAYFAGKKAASAIDAYLNGKPLPTHDPFPLPLRARFESEE